MSGNNRGRRNWTLSMTFALLVALAAAVIGHLAGAETENTDRVFLRSSAGAVLFDHGKHNEAVESCARCHHDLYGAAQATSCAECHDEDVQADDFEHIELKEFHGRDCSKCHEQIVENDSAVSCRTCHPGTQQDEERDMSCSACHGEDYTPDMMIHDEFLEIEDHTCQGCHSPSTVSEAYHMNCTNCHLESSPERFTAADGGVQCSACHLL